MSEAASIQPASPGACFELTELLEESVLAAVAAASRLTDGGREIDEHQVVCERVAYAATELEAVRTMAGFAEAAAGAGHSDAGLYAEQAAVVIGEVAGRVRAELALSAPDLGLDDASLVSGVGSDRALELLRDMTREDRVRAIGRQTAVTAGANNAWLPDEDAVMVRDSVRSFAAQEVAPLAERIHRHDELVSDDIISSMAEMGYFGMAAPEPYGGLGMGNLPMIITTEELSRASLAAAGSLITRPEILTKALLKGGTEEQKLKWLPQVCSGELMVAVSVTEPDIGSDVASVACRAEPGQLDGQDGYLINGAKAWCTFAGRANVLALLARTDPDPGAGARGLSLFIVEKDAFGGHEFEMRQAGGGVLTGKADATPGYRGMHSYTLGFENYFVPAENLVGEEAGKGKGFYLQMGGFAAGRLQTGGRASGLAQAALEASASYAGERKQFGKPLIDFHLTQHKLGRMASWLEAARRLTYRAALAMDEDESNSLEPAMAKLLACDIAVWLTQEGQLLHGGWGYAEEYPISRYVIDAQVLPIFEGVKPVLELKVIARQLLAV